MKYSCDSVTETESWEPEKCPFCAADETVAIPKKQYNKLIDDSLRLNALRNAGVDNWEWYGEAMDEYRRSIERTE